MSLAIYRQKRDFKKTREPKGHVEKASGHRFVIQKHHASHLHYDFRLELDGVLKSWAVPKGPSLNPKVRRLAVEVEDHPVSYAGFEGEIPRGEYGGGHVLSWDQGQWRPLDAHPLEALKKGRLEFELRGEKLQGRWVLVRTGAKTKKPNWLLIKRTDAYASSERDITEERPESVLTDRTIEDIEAGSKQTSRRKIKTDSTSKSNSHSAPDEFVAPQLATLVAEPPNGPQWIHEIKFDGYRTEACITTVGKKTSVKLLTRKGLDWTHRYGTMANEFKKLKLRNAVIDGEIVALDREGRSSFHTLQERLKSSRPQGLVFYAFDLLSLDGEDWTNRPLIERKERLQSLLEKSSSRIVYSEHWQTSGQVLLEQSCRFDLEGIVSKRVDAPYEAGRGGTWLKSKCGYDQEFVIAGYTPPSGARKGFGSLLLGAYAKEGEFTYVGRVGTGFDDETLHDLMKRFAPLKIDRSPFDEKVPESKQAQWLKLKLIAQVKFRGWTADRILRQASFQGLREDKKPREVGLDLGGSSLPVSARTTSKTSSRNAHAPGLTHPDRVLFPDLQLTKQDLADYYLSVQRLMLPHVSERPLAFLRCPSGIGDECFFQKHSTETGSASLHSVTVALKEQKKAKENVLFIDSKEGLLGLTQIGVIEIHCWNTHVKHLERPDDVVFDLDPAPDVEWAQVIDGAFEIKHRLDQLKLKSFLKLSGGKGLHIHVPIAPNYTWDEAKLFAKTVSMAVADQDPRHFTVTITKSKRDGRVFLDYLRNGYGATAVAPYCVRARKNAPIALPIRWDELDQKIRPDEFGLRNISSWLKKRKADPWTGFSKLKQKLSIIHEYRKAASPPSR